MASGISKKKIKALFEGLKEYLNRNYVPEVLSEISDEDTAYFADRKSEAPVHSSSLDKLSERLDITPESLNIIPMNLNAGPKKQEKPKKFGTGISDKKPQARKRESLSGGAFTGASAPMSGEAFKEPFVPMAGAAFNKIPDSFAGAALSDAPAQVPAAKKAARSLDDLMKNVSQTWQESLFRLIDEKGFSDTEVYKRAKIDRKLFSKIRSNPDYQPKKNTAVAFALALKLSLDEVKDFLARAGYALSPSSRFDLIIQYFVEQEVYDLYTINLALFEHDQPLLE